MSTDLSYDEAMGNKFPKEFLAQWERLKKNKNIYRKVKNNTNSNASGLSQLNLELKDGRQSRNS